MTGRKLQLLILQPEVKKSEHTASISKQPDTKTSINTDKGKNQ
jgi:hypothetical protein